MSSASNSAKSKYDFSPSQMDPYSTPPSPSKPPVPLSPREITSPQQIGTQLALLTKRQAELSLSLNALVADREDIDESLEHLTILGQRVEQLLQEVDGRNGPTHGQPRGLGFQPNGHEVYEEEDEGLLERVRRVWETSERVGGKVRRLDVEVGRVKESADIVSEVIDLKVCEACLLREYH